MVKYRIVSIPGSQNYYKVQRKYWFGWWTVYTNPLDYCESYVDQIRNPVVKEYK